MPSDALATWRALEFLCSSLSCSSLSFMELLPFDTCIYPPTAPTEIAESNVYLQENALSPSQSPQPPTHFSGNHTHHNMEHLEQLLDFSLATVAVIQFSGNTLADVFTPRAYDIFKALYTLAALDATKSTTKPKGSEIPNCSTFSDIGNNYPYSSNHSPPLPNSSLAIPRTGRIHISISVDNVMFFWWAGLAAVSFIVVFFNFPRHCEGDATGHF